MMRVLLLLSVVVGLSLWGQARVDQSQIWNYLAIAWLLICLCCLALHLASQNAWLRSFKTRGGMGSVSMLAVIFAVSFMFDNSQFFAKWFTSVERPITPIAAVAQSATTEYRDGHFNAVSEVNGHEVTMLVDTGASLVILRHEDAEAAGIDMSTLDFDTPVLTASGKSFLARITIKKLRIQNLMVEDVAAAVMAPGQLSTSLLGMSFLSAMEEVVIRGNKMSFHQ